jgi:protocatechuate 3,4-dioxygenase beta subunit
LWTNAYNIGRERKGYLARIRRNILGNYNVMKIVYVYLFTTLLLPMERKEFLKKGFASLGLIAIAPLVSACQKDTVDTTTSGTTTSTTGSTNGNSSSNCTVTNSETEGPFPTKSPTTLVMQNIKSDRTGTPLNVTITIKNTNANCVALAGAMVDIWHCDRDGLYSEYGGTGMQAADMTAYHFLRGRQTTNANGEVGFSTIFPGWYSGRATHIHVHIYNASGKSLLVTQIAFPVAVCDTVYTTATQYYTKGKQDTSNEKDNVFSDGYSLELSSISGSVTAGYNLTHTIVVSA